MAAGRRSPPKASDDELPSPSLPGGACVDVGALDEDAHGVLARATTNGGIAMAYFNTWLNSSASWPLTDSKETAFDNVLASTPTL